MSTVNAIVVTPAVARGVRLSGPVGDRICAHIGCDMFDVVSLDDSIDAFVDDEGAINGSTFNLPLTILAHRLGVPAVLFGTGVLVGIEYGTGETISLTASQTTQILTAVLTKPDARTLDRLYQSLAPMPEAIALLRDRW